MLYSRSLLVIYFIYSSVYIVNPNLLIYVCCILDSTYMDDIMSLSEVSVSDP